MRRLWQVAKQLPLTTGVVQPAEQDVFALQGRDLAENWFHDGLAPGVVGPACLGAELADGTDPFTPARARARAGGRVDVRRVGIDITVSAPKSVSVLQALADPQTAAVIAGCHDRAVRQALGYLQRQAGHGLRGHHGDGQAMDRVATDGLIAAAFTHHTSRAGDPALNTHLVVPNLLRGRDRKWSAVDSRAVFRHAKTAGLIRRL